MTYKPTTEVTKGGIDRTRTDDDSLIDLTRALLNQAKIMNTHLSRLTDEELNETDISKEVI